jgi:AcrR family transcriptional regulator
MTEHEKNTENLIFDAARDVFVEKGFEGTRMEEIAKKANINKALLHYYYRTKEKLFNAIFDRVFGEFAVKVINVMVADVPLFQKIEFFVENYIDFFMRNPHVPAFIINEINRNPKRLIEMFDNKIGLVKNGMFDKLSVSINQEIEKGIIKPIEAEQLVVNILSLCIFPSVARPIIKGVIFKNDNKQYDKFLEARKKEVAKFIIDSIKK